MVTILPKEDDSSEGFRNFGQGLASGFMNRSDEMSLQKSLSSLGQNPSARQILDAITNTRTYNPESKQQVLKNYLGVAEFQELKRKAQEQEKLRATELADKKAERQAKALEEQGKKDLAKGNALALIGNSDLPDEKKKELADEINNGRLSFEGVKEIVKPKKEGVKSDFEKNLSKEHVKQYVDAEKAIIQSQRNLNDLARVRELKDALAGPFGYFKAVNPFNDNASELRALGFGVIEPIVKIFNPSGPIAQKKLEQLQKVYGISPLDSSATIEGKVKALERYANYAKNISEQKIALFQKYDGNPPLGEVTRLDLEAQAIGEQMAAEDPAKPQIFYSTKDGRQVQPKSLEQQEDLIKKGLITDVKPTQ